MWELLTVCSQFWFGPVTNKELEEEVAHDHVCMLLKTSFAAEF